MKLTKTEKFAILLTALFLVFSIGLRAGRDGGREELYISTEVERRPLDSAVETNDAPTDAPDMSLNNEVRIPVNINTADAELLTTLDGIGEKLAARIIDYREENGNFERPQDITLVPGIGDGIYSRICADIVV